MALDLDLRKGSYHARLAASPAEILACQKLRHLAFFGVVGVDADGFDPTWSHLMVTDRAEDVVCTFRFRVTPSAGVLSGYAATFYGLNRIAALGGAILEMGRLCCGPDRHDPQILRLAWAALTQIVDQHEAHLLLGCVNFPGTDPSPFRDAFRQLAARHVAPARVLPDVKAQDVIWLDEGRTMQPPQHPMPSMLRSYLTMGGWVSDHAVLDHGMQTIHVLTALEVAKVTPQRAKVLRALA